jgi:IS30 family transposase
MGGRRHTKQELQQIQALVDQGLTSKEIAKQLGRTEAAIRNLRHREAIIKQAQDETKALLERRDQLRDEVNALQQQQHALSSDIEKLRLENKVLQTAVNIDKILLQRTLTQALTILKDQRPDLFALNEAEQIGVLTKWFFDQFSR